MGKAEQQVIEQLDRIEGMLKRLLNPVVEVSAQEKARHIASAITNYGSGSKEHKAAVKKANER